MFPKPKKGSSKPNRPTRDEFELEELGEHLVKVKEENTIVRLEVFNSEEVVGRIVDMESRTKIVHVSNYWDIVKFPFLDIMKDRDVSNCYWRNSRMRINALTRLFY